MKFHVKFLDDASVARFKNWLHLQVTAIVARLDYDTRYPTVTDPPIHV